MTGTHKPDRWTVVDASPPDAAGAQVVLFASCICGDDNCGFTLIASQSDAFPTGGAS